MMTLFMVIFIVVIVQRVVELFIAVRNREWMLAQGAIEVGRSHYKYMVWVHIGFLCAISCEVLIKSAKLAPWWPLALILFTSAQIIRIWCIASLGRYWNVRILVLPGAKVVRQGPYRYLRHPNYTVVLIEFITLPLIFGAYLTLALFLPLKLILLSIRIPMEEKALEQVTDYGKVFQDKPRLIP